MTKRFPHQGESPFVYVRPNVRIKQVLMFNCYARQMGKPTVRQLELVKGRIPAVLGKLVTPEHVASDEIGVMSTYTFHVIVGPDHPEPWQVPL
jgi:hypothetical protein